MLSQELETLDNGKPYAVAYSVDLPNVVKCLRWASQTTAFWNDSQLEIEKTNFRVYLKTEVPGLQEQSKSTCADCRCTCAKSTRVQNLHSNQLLFTDQTGAFYWTTTVPRSVQGDQLTPATRTQKSKQHLDMEPRSTRLRKAEHLHIHVCGKRKRTKTAKAIGWNPETYFTFQSIDVPRSAQTCTLFHKTYHQLHVWMSATTAANGVLLN